MNEFTKPAPAEDLDLDQANLHLAEISALLDEGLAESKLQTIDRIANDPEARSFYRRARALEGVLETADSMPRSEPPIEVWQRIADSTQIPTGPTGWGPRRAEAGSAGDVSSNTSRNWGLLAAAGLLVATATAVLWWFIAGDAQRAASAPSASAQVASIDLGSRSGEMTESRFFDLAAEILEADEAYRRELFDLMAAVESELAGSEFTYETSSASDFEDRQDRPLTRGFDSGEGRRTDGLNINLF